MSRRITAEAPKAKTASGLDNDYWLIDIQHPRRIKMGYQIEAEAYGRACDGHIRSVLPVSMQLYDEFRRRD